MTKERLSGALVKLASYRGTSCDVDVADYVVRRINGKKTPEVERALVASRAMKASVLDLMKLLTWRDFETLVDLVFSTSGWRRVGRVGGTQKTLDLGLADRVRQEIEYTDFPEGAFEMYFTDRVLMLKGEY